MSVSSPHRRRRRAIIIGGSMSGLFAAAFLRQMGWDADVYERSPIDLVGARGERADMLAAGDGIRSSVRAQVAPTVQPIYSGYYIWRGTPNERDLKPQTRDSIFPYFTFFLPEQQQIIGYPIAGFDNDL